MLHLQVEPTADWRIVYIGTERNRCVEKSVPGSPKYPDVGGLLRNDEQLWERPSKPCTVDPELTLSPQYIL